MERTGLEPGIKLGRLKDWLFRIQIGEVTLICHKWRLLYAPFHGLVVTRKNGLDLLGHDGTKFITIFPVEYYVRDD